jgi:hypothetical protein
MSFLYREELKERYQARQDYPGLHTWIDSIMQSNRKRSRPYSTRVSPQEMQRQKRRQLAARKQYAIRMGNFRSGGTVGRLGTNPAWGVRGNPDEKKYLDGTLSATNVNSTGTSLVPSFNIIGVGSGPSKRNGRKITAKGLYIKGGIKIPAHTSNAETHQRVRLILYLDSNHNGSATAPAFTTIFKEDAIDSFLNLEETPRFTILHDKVYTLNQICGAYDGANSDFGEYGINFKININMSGWIQYNGTDVNGLITEITKNNIGLYAIAGENATTKPQVYFKSRFRYIDN